jgi:lipopolysaccharide transport system permease protein
MKPATADDRYFGHEHMTVIQPATGGQSVDLRELWAYRELLWVLTARDIKVRYRQTALGILWAVLQPTLLVLAFSVFLGHLAQVPSDGLPYPLFTFAALAPWSFFAGALAHSANSVVGSANLISKVYFPRLIIPLASVGAGLVDFMIALGILLLLMLYYGIGWSLQLLAVLPLTLVLAFAALGMGTLLSALTVAYRDFRYVVPFMLQFWMFVTPVVYPASLVPESWRWLLHLNPMAGLIEGFRSALLGRPFDLPALGISVVIAVAVFGASVFYFERVERRFADII